MVVCMYVCMHVCMYVCIETTAQATGTSTCRVGGGVACRHFVPPYIPLARLGLLPAGVGLCLEVSGYVFGGGNR